MTARRTRRTRPTLLSAGAAAAAIAILAQSVTAGAGAAERAAGMSPARLARIDAAVEAAIAAKELPGAVVLVEHRGRVAYRKAFGNRAVQPSPEPMTPDTIFDVASLTKAVVTAPSVMILVEEGKIRLGDPVTRYIPEFAPAGDDRAKVTVEQLLLHRAGFPPDDPITLYTGTREEIFARKYAQPLKSKPGSEFVYSDVGYEVLGEIVRRVSGMGLDRFSEARIFRPLGMRDTGFRPFEPLDSLPPGVAARQGSAPAGEDSRIAPTERREGRWMRGEVHDPRAFAVGGVAGHAGLFSTADDLAKFCRMILSGGSFGKVRILSPLSVDAMTRPRFSSDADVRALGFDMETGFSSVRGDLFPPGSFGHTGFTGTSLWIDPSSRSFVVLLSNRVHPDGSGNVVRLRSLVASIVAAALTEDTRTAARKLAASMPARARQVRAGVDVLIDDAFRPVAGKRIGLVTNATGVARDGRSTVDVLSSAEAKKAGVTLVRIFSPEHGLRTDADAPVPDQTHPGTGLPVVSLYGDRRRPGPRELADLDALVLDIQDVGVRFYTYTTTGGYLLEEAAKAKIPLVVLDRPDPIGGLAVEGPLADPDRLSFTAYGEIPVRYGMTPGELLTLFDSENRIGARLEVVRMRGWSRELWYDETGLEWVNPSPNMRSLAAAALYPGVGLLEPTNVSVGRGTDTPFEVIGAPWLDGSRLAAFLTARRVPGVRFTPLRFTPSASVHQGKSCGGIRITVVDRQALASVALGIELASALKTLHPVEWDRSRFGALLANAATLARFEAGDTPESIVASWKKDLAAFAKVRARHLLY
ncbi:MAG TPA: exo-beta-N-acetylmuramidase NamZ domain-containing protein [Thermoanaerobaculia bacterium]|nr:exo-beta-N-acetylmuramidase NamZ domain-containing protein [Thermoanaerobaculia bacterium]